MDGLTISQARVQYGQVEAVKDLSIEVPLGTVTALLGPSGCGKSSLLRAIAGLEPLAAGSVSWRGRNMEQVPVHQRHFGMMFQDGQLFPSRNVSGNIAYGIAHLPKAQRQEKVKELLDSVGLSGYQDRSIDTLSGGQAQRVALARCLAPQPQLLLLDEPLSALDRALREELVITLRQIIRDLELTVVYVTHDQDEAFSLADQIVIMDQGKILAANSAEEIWTHPGSQAAASFLGYRPFLSAAAAAEFGIEIPGDTQLAVAPGGLKMCLAEQGIAANARDLRVRRGKYLAEVAWRQGSEEYSGQAEAGLGLHLSKKQTSQEVGLQIQRSETCVVPVTA
ncbi:ABC transporter ATP-binding protein [Varibaculum cambriense]|uniref:ABC transporter ATP-binding protein n=1 Tax=Varibaculum cambriense TaxID=184870 RepID=UPI0025558B2D|nr:ABC transporter ATP-binding protein [Varibaculum cambriense]MDK8274093.1 ABC transporter ATP-binding protein [Varibaculum cambriense]